MTTWILEEQVFADGHRGLAAAARNSGGVVIGWDDDWWTNGAWPKITGPAVFHGSLGNADRIVRELPWQPGAFCATARFACSAWWATLRDELVAERFVFTTVAGLVAEGPPADFGDQVFVRPDSPLKPFSGRGVGRAGITFTALDHGFYYDDEDLPIVVQGCACSRSTRSVEPTSMRAIGLRSSQRWKP